MIVIVIVGFFDMNFVDYYRIVGSFTVNDDFELDEYEWEEDKRVGRKKRRISRMEEDLNRR